MTLSHNKTPQRNHHRDLPVVGTATFDDVSSTRRALQSLEMGVFNYPAQLCDAFGTDDRIKGVIQTRLDALASLPLEVTPPNTRKRPVRIAERIKQNWKEWLCDAEIKRLHVYFSALA